MNSGTPLALALLVVGALLVFAGTTGTSLLSALNLGSA